MHNFGKVVVPPWLSAFFAKFSGQFLLKSHLLDWFGASPNLFKSLDFIFTKPAIITLSNKFEFLKHRIHAECLHLIACSFLQVMCCRFQETSFKCIKKLFTILPFCQDLTLMQFEKFQKTLVDSV